MGKAERTWLYIMAGVTAFGVIGGIQSDVAPSEWGWFVAGCVIIALVGLGVIGNFKKS